MLYNEAHVLPGWRPCWDSINSSRVRQAEKEDFRNFSVLLGRKDDSKVPILPSVEVAMDLCRVHCHNFMNLFGFHVIGISHVLAE